MAQRFLKILLPWVEKERGLGLLTRYEALSYWQEELSKENFVVNVLVEAERSEIIMDVFERTFTGIKGFHLIVFSVAASLPRPREPEREKKDNTEKTTEEIKEEKLARAARVSREELFASISDSARLSQTFMVMTALAAVVAAVGLLTNKRGGDHWRDGNCPFSGAQCRTGALYLSGRKRTGQPCLEDPGRRHWSRAGSYNVFRVLLAAVQPADVAAHFW